MKLIVVNILLLFFMLLSLERGAMTETAQAKAPSPTKPGDGDDKNDDHDDDGSDDEDDDHEDNDNVHDDANETTDGGDDKRDAKDHLFLSREEASSFATPRRRDSSPEEAFHEVESSDRPADERTREERVNPMSHMEETGEVFEEKLKYQRKVEL